MITRIPRIVGLCLTALCLVLQFLALIIWPVATDIGNSQLSSNKSPKALKLITVFPNLKTKNYVPSSSVFLNYSRFTRFPTPSFLTLVDLQGSMVILTRSKLAIDSFLIER
jgi:hypothetical protein